MVTEDPGVIFEVSEQIDEEAAVVVVTGGGALVEIADIDEEGVRVFLSPAADLGGAAGETSDFGFPAVAQGGKHVAVEVGGVDDGNGAVVG